MVFNALLKRKPWTPTKLGRWSLGNWERKMELAQSDSCVYGLSVYTVGDNQCKEPREATEAYYAKTVQKEKETTSS